MIFSKIVQIINKIMANVKKLLWLHISIMALLVIFVNFGTL